MSASFENAAGAGFLKVQSTYEGRGEEYGDTWGAVPGLYNEDMRREDAWALMRVKMLRAMYTRGEHRDTIIDLVAYACAFLQWSDEGSAGEDW